ncbi:hypothetical protein CL629_00800 [bacterium]|nr:hypothetical protein [bacterium]
MALISVNTPQGVQHGRIAGDTPTEEEWEKIKEHFPAAQGQEFEYTVAGRPVIEEEVEESLSEVLPDREVKSTSLRYQVGRMDTDEEKHNLLNQLLGTDAIEKVQEDTFVIDQAKVDPAVRRKYGLGDSGRIYLDKPGFTWKDVADFAGESGPSVLAAIGTSLAVTGLGFIPGMLFVGGAAALAKALDESVEHIQGLNRQSAGDVATMIATEGVFNAVFEGGGRAVAKVVGRLIKGPGPTVSSRRMDELINSGLDKDQAFRAAREEALASYQAAIASGAKPTVEAAAGKTLAARALAINEKIIPNAKVGRANARYIEKLLNDLDAGVLSEADALRLLADNNTFVGNLVKQNLSNPDEAFKLTKQHLDDIVKAELKRYEEVFVPSQLLPEQYTQNVELAATLFKTESNNLYDLATTTMGKNAKDFKIQPVIDTLDALRRDNPFIEYSGTLFSKLRKPKYADMSIVQLQQLKAALRLSKGDPDLVATAAQAGIGKLITSIDDLLMGKQVELARDAARGYKIVSKKGVRGVVREDIPPAELDSLRKGLVQWDEANKIYGEGQEQFNNAAVNSIATKAKNKFFNSNKEVMEEVVEAGNVPKLQMYLNAVTPTLKAAQHLTQPGATEALERLQSLVINNKFKQAQRFVEDSGLSGVVPKIQGFIDELPVNDVFRIAQRDAYATEVGNLIELSRAGGNPQMIRESVRNSLAKEWLAKTKLVSQTRGLNDPIKFADEFSALGKEMQDTLFGTETAATMREAMDAFRLTGLDEASASRLFEAIPTMVNQPLKAQMQGLKQLSERAVSESSDSVLKAIKDGKITDSSALVAGLLKNPSSYNRLKSVVGEAELEKVGGVKDMVMNNLVRASIAKEGFSEATVQSGAWGTAFKNQLLAQNKNGSLNAILGVDTVKSLNKIADDAIKISDLPIKGYGGIAAAPAALALIALAWSGHFYAAGISLGAIMGVGRFLRSKAALKLITSPRLRAQEYKAAVRAGAELPAMESVYTINRLSSIAASEMSLIMGSGIFGEMAGETRKKATQEVIKGMSDLQRAPGEPDVSSILSPVRQEPDLTYEEIMQGAARSGNVPGAESVLRRIEEEKLLGVRQ